jgi:hypothetical protein
MEAIMGKGIRRLLAATALALVVFAGCDSTPTVPVPPPEISAISVTPPDVAGNVNVVGDPKAAGAGDVVLIFNQDLGSGVMEEAGPDGSFTAVLKAEVGDQLLVQIKRDNELSDEEYKVVPAY